MIVRKVNSRIPVSGQFKPPFKQSQQIFIAPDDVKCWRRPGFCYGKLGVNLSVRARYVHTKAKMVYLEPIYELQYKMRPVVELRRGALVLHGGAP